MQKIGLKITVKTNWEHIVSEIFIMVFLFYTAYIRLIENTPFALDMCNTSLVLAGVLNYFVIIRNRDYRVLLAAVFMVISWVMCYLMRPSWHYEMVSLVNSIAYIAVAYSFIYDKKSPFFYGVLYYMVAIYIVYKLVIEQVPIRGFLKDGTSYNYISIIVLFYLSLYSLVQIKNKKELTLIQAIVFVVIAFVSYGRSGIISCLSYMMLYIFVKFKENDKKLSTYFITLIIFIIIFFTWNNIYNYVITHSFFKKFQEMGLEGERTDIWKIYYRTCIDSYRSIIVGGNPGIFSAEGNLHNSFLQLYASFGVLFMVSAMLCYFKSFKQMFIEQEWNMFVVGITFSLRAATDKLMYRGYCEIIFYVLILYYILRMKRNNEKKDENDGSVEKDTAYTVGNTKNRRLNMQRK